MTDRGRYRVLFVASHPVQYSAPVFRHLAQHPQLDILVAYCTLKGSESHIDPEFGVAVKWDVPLLDGYPWTHVPNGARHSRLGRFWGLYNPGLWGLLRKDHFDAVVLYTGYRCATFWITVAAALRTKTAVLFGTDAHQLQARNGQRWKARLKAWLWGWLFRLADVVIVPSSGSAHLMHSLGIPAERVVLTPYVVDNDWWVEQAARADRSAVRAAWNIPTAARVVLFCAKLQPWKRPLDLLHAFAQADVPNAYLVYAGDGALRDEVELLARTLGIRDRVRMLGFVNQSKLPEVYSAADLLVLPSDYEPFAVVVNEAMLCRCPVVVSDRVGARYDLVKHGESGFVFPTGNVHALAELLNAALQDEPKLAKIRRAARHQLDCWSPRENVAGTVEAIERAVRLKENSAYV
ncbi:MAG TPA: glycosyltransferase [Candidatus Dormibacteraeota bacterium]|nr:glycosyltransferase [Candidatus Dormibacteraeota bacterium]